MNDRLQASIADWIREGPDRGPEEGLKRALAATRRVGQRPGWSFPTRWLPERVADVAVQVPRLAGAGLVLLLSLLLLIALAIALAGSQPRLRPQLGPAGDSLLAFQEGTQIYAARVDGSERRAISGAVPYARFPVFSPDGSRIAFVGSSAQDAPGRTLYVVRVDGSGEAIDLSQGMNVISSNIAPVSWSPDGRQIAFTADDAGVRRVFVAASDGSGVAPVTDATADADVPIWSPDGSWIGYRTTEADGVRKHLRKVRPDGSAIEDVTTMVTADASLSRLRWRPDGNAVSYAVNYGFGTETRAIIDLGFGHVAELWTRGVGGFPDAGIPWSPDGAHLAFISASEGVIVADDGPTAPYEGQLRELGPVADCWIEWSPDGSALYGGSPDGCTSVVVIPIADPQAAVRLRASTSGVASWQPLAP